MSLLDVHVVFDFSVNSIEHATFVPVTASVLVSYLLCNESVRSLTGRGCGLGKVFI